MGRCPNNKAGGQKKKYLHKQARRTKFLKKAGVAHSHLPRDDMIFDEVAKKALVDAAATAMANEDSKAALPAGRSTAAGATEVLDEDLPGMGRFYCLYCDRHFASDAVRDEHNKTKMHKKRVKMMEKGPRPHCQLDAELAAGMGAPDNGKRSASSPVPSPMLVS